MIGAVLIPWLGPKREWDQSHAELTLLGIQYLGGLGLYVGLHLALLRSLRRAKRFTEARCWRIRFAGFYLSVLGICALGALLGAVVFPIAGGLGASAKTRDELVVAGAKLGGFFFLVWAPGVALVREFVRAGKKR